MLRANLLVILFAFIHLPLTAQQSKIDSLYHVLKTEKEDSNKVNTLNTIGRLIMEKGDYPRIDSLARASLRIAEKISFTKGCMIAYNIIGNVNLYQSNYQDALKNYSVFLDMAIKIGHKRAIANAYGNLGIVYYYLGNYPQSLDNHLKCLKVRQELGDKQGVGGAYINIGAVYQANNDLDQALQFYTKALATKTELKDKHGMASAYGNIGSIEMLQKNYTEALKNELECLKIDQEIEDKRGIGITYGNIGNVYELEGDYPKSIENHLLSLDLSEQIGNENNVALEYLDLGSIYVKLKKIDLSKKYLEEAAPLVNKLGDKELMRTFYQYSVACDSGAHNYEKAFIDFKSYLVYRDSLNNEKNAKKLVSEQMNFDFEQKEQKLKAEEDKQNALNSEKLKRQKLISWLAAGGGIFVIVILGLLFNRYRLKQKNEYQISLNLKQKEQATAVLNTQEEERKRIAEDIHDSLGQLLSTTKMSLQTLSKNGEVNIENPMNLLNQAVHEIRDISFNLMPKTLEEAGLVPALQELTGRINNSGTVKVNLHIHNMQSLQLPRETQFTLYRIVQEAINNSLKYSGSTEINVQLIGENNILVLMIEDDGKGFDMNTVKTGRGLRNMQSRAEWLNGKLAIDSGLGGGTTISLEIPV